jgi:uncharacterized membrane protein YqjE
MSEGNGHSPTPPGLAHLVRKVGVTVFSSLHNRAELLAVELREEELRAVELFIWGLITCFLGLLFLIVATFAVVFMFPVEYRVYVALGFSALYLVATVLALRNLRALAKDESTPFAGSIEEIKRDSEWLESLK